jgi:hypothetical protein
MVETFDAAPSEREAVPGRRRKSVGYVGPSATVLQRTI